MHVLILLPAFLIFLYSLYKLSGDDHIFIRKNISLEQMFDIAFGTLWISLVFARFFYFIFNPLEGENLFTLFFSIKGGISFTGGVIGAVVGLYLIGKYKRFPLGRLFDFFTLSALFALPVGFLAYALVFGKHEIVYKMIGMGFYLILSVLFIRLLYPKLLNRSLKEGNISILFLFLFSLFSFVLSFIKFGKVSIEFITPQTIFLIIIFIFSVFLLLKQVRFKIRSKNKPA